MATSTTDRLPPHAGGPGTSSFARLRDARVLEFTSEAAADVLGGRTVWCVSALPAGAAAAELVHARLFADARQELQATSRRQLAQEADVRVLRCAVRLDAMLAGTGAEPAGASPPERAAYADGVRAGDALLGPGVQAGDVVVLHDALAAALADAVRARGAHAVWHVRRSARGAVAAQAWDFLAPFAHGVDAFVTTAGPRSQGAARARRGARAGGAADVEWLVAAMPSPGRVAVKQVDVSGERGAGFGWRALLADVVDTDRDEHVGGTLHARPVVAAR